MLRIFDDEEIVHVEGKTKIPNKNFSRLIFFK